MLRPGVGWHGSERGEGGQCKGMMWDGVGWGPRGGVGGGGRGGLGVNLSHKCFLSLHIKRLEGVWSGPIEHDFMS